MTLSKRLAKPRVLLAPGIYDALSALIAERSGFEALYLSGRPSPIHGWDAPTSA